MSNYDILGVKPTATKDEIKTAYRRLAKKYHPDMPSGNQKKFIEVKQAYESLLHGSDGDNYTYAGSAGHNQHSNPFNGFEEWIRQQREAAAQADRRRRAQWDPFRGVPPPGTEGFYTHTRGDWDPFTDPEEETYEEKINGDGIREILQMHLDELKGVPSMFSWGCDGCGKKQQPTTRMFYLVGGKKKVCRSCKEKMRNWLIDDDNFDY